MKHALHVRLTILRQCSASRICRPLHTMRSSIILRCHFRRREIRAHLCAHASARCLNRLSVHDARVNGEFDGHRICRSCHEHITSLANSRVTVLRAFGATTGVSRLPAPALDQWAWSRRRCGAPSLGVRTAKLPASSSARALRHFDHKARVFIVRQRDKLHPIRGRLSAVVPPSGDVCSDSRVTRIFQRLSFPRSVRIEPSIFVSRLSTVA